MNRRPESIPARLRRHTHVVRGSDGRTGIVDDFEAVDVDWVAFFVRWSDSPWMLARITAKTWKQDRWRVA